MTQSKNSIKYGDIFRIGNHLLGCGDARDVDFVNQLVGDKKIQLVLTDCPYGVKFTESKEGFSNIKVNKKILNDDIISEPEYSQFTTDWLSPIIPHLATKNTIYIFNSDKMIFSLREGMEKAGVKLSQLIIWIKNQPIIGRKDYLLQHELIAFGWHGTHSFKKAKDKSVIYCPKPAKSPLHPTQKPIDLLRRLILNSSDVKNTVYDCFAGSGSLGVAAEQTQRSSILIERDEAYCQTIIDRMEKLFNIKAELIHEKR